jgi:hypothetical protein
MVDSLQAFQQFSRCTRFDRSVLIYYCLCCALYRSGRETCITYASSVEKFGGIESKTLVELFDSGFIGGLADIDVGRIDMKSSLCPVLCLVFDLQQLLTLRSRLAIRDRGCLNNIDMMHLSRARDRCPYTLIARTSMEPMH